MRDTEQGMKCLSDQWSSWNEIEATFPKIKIVDCAGHKLTETLKQIGN